MNREQANKMLPFIKAFAEGKPVEFNDCTRGWIELEDAKFTGDVDRYRLRAEPEYVPYSFDDAAEVIGKVAVFRSGNQAAYLITQVSANGVVIHGAGGYSFGSLLGHFAHIDGTPFGKLKSVENATN